MNVLDMFKLDGKVAVVTGGAGLYGFQVVSALAEAGAKVYVASRNRQTNEEKMRSLLDKGYDISILEFDLESEESILSLAEEIYKREGRVDILVNNAVLHAMKGYNDTA